LIDLILYSWSMVCIGILGSPSIRKLHNEHVRLDKINIKETLN
jgi:hypothetical protein